MAAGDKGGSAALELAWVRRIGNDAVELSGFADHGEVHAPDVRETAKALGLGAGLVTSRAIVRATFATDIDHSSGLTRSTRAFVSSTLRF